MRKTSCLIQARRERLTRLLEGIAQRLQRTCSGPETIHYKRGYSIGSLTSLIGTLQEGIVLTRKQEALIQSIVDADPVDRPTAGGTHES